MAKVLSYGIIVRISTLTDSCFCPRPGTLIVVQAALQTHGGVESSLQQRALEWASPSTLPLSFGIIAFLYCTQFLTLPIEAAMERPEEYASSVWGVFALTAVCNIAFALLCLYTWRHGVHDIVILNVRSSWGTTAAKVCLCLDLLFSYPLVLFPSMEMIESYFSARGQLVADSVSPWPRNCLRACLVTITTCIALSIPRFALLTDIFAGFGQTILAFVLPPALYMVLSASSSPREHTRPSSWALGGAGWRGSKRMLLWGTIVFGVSACLISTSSSLYALWHPSTGK